jgi:hypothetical protein
VIGLGLIGCIANQVAGEPPADTWTAENTTLSAQDGTIFFANSLENLVSEIGGNLTGVGTPTFTAGLHNNALTLNGSTQYATLPDTADLDVGLSNEPFTIVQRVKGSSDAVTQCILNRGGGGPNDWNTTNGNQYLLQYVGSAGFHFYFNTAGGATTLQVSGAGLMNSAWHTLVIAYDGTTTRSYVDGVLSAWTTTATYTKPSASNTTHLGHYQFSGGGGHMSGQFDEPVMWNGYGADQTFATALQTSYRVG